MLHLKLSSQFSLFQILYSLVVTAFLALCLALTMLFAPTSAYGDTRAQSLTIAYAEKWPPFSYRDPSGNPKGILVEIANFVLKEQLGYQVKHVLQPWKRAQMMVKNGTYDALLAVPSPDRQAYTTPNRSEVYSMQVRAFIAKSSPRLSDLMDQENPLQHPEGRFSLLMGDKTCEAIYDQYQSNFYTNSNIQQIFKMLTSGRSDLLLHSKVAATRTMIELNMQQDIVLHPKVFKNVSLFMLFSQHFEGRDKLIQQLDAMLEEMKDNNEYTAHIERIEQEEIEYSIKYTGL